MKESNIEKLQELEVEHKKLSIEILRKESRTKLRINLSILTIVLGGFITIITSVITKHIENTNSIELEKKKFESNLIYKAIDTDSRVKSIKNLNFFLEMGLIEDTNGEIRNSINENSVPALKSLETIKIIVQNNKSEPLQNIDIFLEDIFIGKSNIDGTLNQLISSDGIGGKELKAFSNETECEYISISTDRENKIVLTIKCN